MLSFAGEDGEGEEAVEVRREKFNTRLVSNDEETMINAKGNEVNGKPDIAKRKPEKAARRRSVQSSPPPKMLRPNRELQLPLPNDEHVSHSPSSSPEPAPVRSMASTLEKTNAQIAELKASMKRNVQPSQVVETRKSALEQMIPETAIRGRKRKHGAKDEYATLDFLNAFRTKLERAAPATPSQSLADVSHDVNKQDNEATRETNEQQTQGADNGDEAELCDLHFIADCQSCRSWDKNGGGDADDKDEGGEAWMSHALSFEKDRLGKDLNWKRKNEEELVVIDPREKAKDLREEARAKKLAKMGKGGQGPEWGREREPRKAA